MNASIETTLLVAVWENPTIFQGYFKIIPPNSVQEFFIFYRCLLEDYPQEQIREQEFFPEKVQFTHLYNHLGIMHQTEQLDKDALYLLKYALFVTVGQMLSNSRHLLAYIDEIALNSLVKRTITLLQEPTTSKTHEDLGFAVSMDFQPMEETSSKALLALLRLAEHIPYQKS
jgi:hypothetical protein